MSSAFRKVSILQYLLVLSVVMMSFIFVSEAHAQIPQEQLDAMQVQVDALALIVGTFSQPEGEVLGVSILGTQALNAQKAALEKQIASLNVRITELVEERTYVRKKLDVVLQEIEESKITPSCTLSTDKKSYTLKETIKLRWSSENAIYAEFVPDTSGKDNLKVPTGKYKADGTKSFVATVLGNPFIVMKVTAENGKIAKCKRVIPVYVK